MQNIPQRRGGAELRRLDAVEHVVAGDHHKPDGRDRPARQQHERRQRDHRGADGEDHLGDDKVVVDIELQPNRTTVNSISTSQRPRVSR